MNKIKIFIGIVLLFSSLTFLIQYNSELLDNRVKVIECPNGTTEEINKSKLFVCGSIINPYYVNEDRQNLNMTEYMKKQYGI